MLYLANFMISKLYFVQNKYLSSVSNNGIRTPFIDVIKSLLQNLGKYLSHYYLKKAKCSWYCCFIVVLYQSVIGITQNQVV